MDTARTVLLVDCGSHPLQDLTARVRRVGFRVLRAKTPEDGREVLRESRHAVGALVLPSDFSAPDLGLALRAFRELSRDSSLPILVAGPRPAEEDGARLRSAGAELALFEPLDDHTLRFQLNRALCRRLDPRAERRAVRAPVDWAVRVRSGGREKPARVYCFSATGAFLATSRPSSRGSLLYLTLPLPARSLDLAGRVVMTNVPGNLMHDNLPLGMAVQFTGVAPEAVAALRCLAEDQSRALEL